MAPSTRLVRILAAALLACLLSASARAQLLTATPLPNAGGDAIFVTAPQGDTSRLFVVGQGGSIRVYSVAAGTFNTVLFAPGFPGLSSGGETGLLGLAFHPQYAQNGYFYVYYTQSGGNRLIARYRVNQSDPNRADMTTGLTILTVPNGVGIHNGGWIAFG